MPVASLFSFDGQTTGMEIPDNITSPLNPIKFTSPEVVIWGDRVFVGGADGFHEAVAWTVPTQGGQGGTGVNSQPRIGEPPVNNPIHTADGTVVGSRPIGDPSIEPAAKAPVAPPYTGAPATNDPVHNKTTIASHQATGARDGKPIIK
jgi:hypothetical protein